MAVLAGTGEGVDMDEGDLYHSGVRGLGDQTALTNSEERAARDKSAFYASQHRCLSTYNSVFRGVS